MTGMILALIAMASMGLFVGSWADKIILPAHAAIDDIRAQIVHCSGRFICDVRYLSAVCLVECIHADYVCDGTAQCKNGVDEHKCEHMCEGMVLCNDKKTCARPCDGEPTCPGSEDEKGCPTKCPKPKLLCSDMKTCASACDGDDECPDKADEFNCGPKCEPHQLLCADGKSCGTPCDRTPECPGEGDEMNCPFQCRCKKGEYICLASNKCLGRDDVCEGRRRRKHKKKKKKGKGHGIARVRRQAEDGDDADDDNDGSDDEDEDPVGTPDDGIDPGTPVAVDGESIGEKKKKKKKNKKRRGHDRGRDAPETSCFNGDGLGDDEHSHAFGTQCQRSKGSNRRRLR